jgi:hypothetical protein
MRRMRAMRRIVENMGLDWSRQHSKLLEQKAKFSCMDIHTHDAGGRLQEMLSMPVEKLPLWLASSLISILICMSRARRPGDRYGASS